jgi:hypothetical protein
LIQAAAHSRVEKRRALFDLRAELQRRQPARLAEDDPDRLAERLALSALPRSVLAGELAP